METKEFQMIEAWEWECDHCGEDNLQHTLPQPGEKVTCIHCSSTFIIQKDRDEMSAAEKIKEAFIEQQIDAADC